ncbi:type VI secretion system protein TssA [Luteimonas sp. BDR2-5]|uniref:type VI secretion system protein TssA n=1 Tax=Proluteimonas luteida TaxID=2878685 RepID=UPI001E62F382|nr:type VI secretion system protein TssA [Luteimonas sp. BDR2-5]MCD9029081.1 type VI secretion system protein TssA [Luteimonas sp. BDR2-5]
MHIDISEWLKPIRDDAPCGDDVSFSDTFDRIREARRADDPNLSQGDWEHELKVANWREVITLAGRMLGEQSKDLQAAAWLGEALIAQHHLDGAIAAFELLAALQEQYWDGLYPLVDDGDLDERAAKIAWFRDYGTLALLGLKLGEGEGGYTLADWQVSRDVDNLARQDANAHEQALGEGKPSGEMFDKAIDANPDGVLLAWHERIALALEAFGRFKAVSDAKLGNAGPSLAKLEDQLKRLQQIVTRAARAKGLIADSAAAGAGTGADDEAAAADGTLPAPAAPAPVGGALNLSTGGVASKAAVVRSLVEIAAWFRRVEPHSPVSFLLDRAVAWADTPLDQWLGEVLGDDAALSRIRSRIGLPD